MTAYVKTFVVTTLLTLLLSGCMGEFDYKTEIPVSDRAQFMVDEPWVELLEGSVEVRADNSYITTILATVDAQGIGKIDISRTSLECAFPLNFNLNEERSSWIVEAPEGVAAKHSKESISECVIQHMKDVREQVVEKQYQWNKKVKRLQSWEKQ